MKFPRLRPVSDHASEVGLLALIAVGVLCVMIGGIWHADEKHPFDPSAYLVVLTLIIGAIKERWTQRSVDRMGQQLADSAPPPLPGPAGTPTDPQYVTEAPKP